MPKLTEKKPNLRPIKLRDHSHFNELLLKWDKPSLVQLHYAGVSLDISGTIECGAYAGSYRVVRRGEYGWLLSFTFNDIESCTPFSGYAVVTLKGPKDVPTP